MAVDIYTELLRLEGRIKALEDAAVQPVVAQVAPVTYFRSGVLWAEALAQKPALVMINPNSGPGASADLSYVKHVQDARTAGVSVFGYVHTRYGARAVNEVKLDVDRYRQWYSVVDIFVDTASNRPEYLPYYTELSEHIRAAGGKVLLNPGTKTIEPYAQLADYVMVAESDVATYRARVAPAWEANYPGKMYHCVHSCSALDMPGVVALAKQRKAGLVYVTNDGMANPYDTLPTYWAAFCAAVRG